jgi:16S rRNA (uracil1498-N3)-methyltransferase
VRVPRLYWPAPLREETAPLPEGAARHLLKVLRRRDGDAVVLFDGQGHVAEGVLCDVVGMQGKVILGPPREDRSAEPPCALHLGLPLLRGERLDVALQKACELGVTEITLLQTERTEVKFETGPRGARRLAHAEGVLIHAAQQSGRTVVPRLHSPVALAAFSEQRSEPLKLVLDPEGAPLDRATLGTPVPEAIVLLTGPEGGLSERECGALGGQGFHRWRLGNRILRAETAPLAALATLATLLGDF